MNQENKDTSPHVKMPGLQISPETEWYLKNTSYLQLVEEIESARVLLKEVVLSSRTANTTSTLIYNIEQFLNKRK